MMCRIPFFQAAFLVLTLGALPGDVRAQNVVVWDTIKPAADRLTPEAVAARTHWVPVQAAAEKSATTFQGDAVLSNGRVLAVARKQGAGVDVYALGGGRAIPRVRLVPVTATGEPAVRLNQ